MRGEEQTTRREVIQVQIRVNLRPDGKVDITFKPTRPGEQRTLVVTEVPIEEVKGAAEVGVGHMRHRTKFALPE